MFRAAAVLVLLSGCASHVVMRRTPAQGSGTLGPLIACAPNNGPCATDPNQDGARFNQSNTTYYTLPACEFGIDAILVESGALVVQCAAPSGGGGLPVTEEDGGTR